MPQTTQDTISSGPPSKRLKYDIEIDNTFATRYEETKKLKTPLFKNFKLQFQDQMPTVSIFSETTEKPAGAVENVEYEGVIGAEATMTNDLAFASNMTNRFISKTTVANTREKAQETEDLKTAFNPRGKDALASSNEASKKGKEKRTRENVTDDEIKARIFALFKDYDYIRLKDIVAKLNLPEGPVRRILIKIADLVKEIEHRNTWRLKAQFRSN